MVKDFDIAVLPTVENTEHCSNSILEYMACSLPVVASRVGGNPELVQHQVTGLLVRPSDPGDLAQALVTLCASKELRLTMGARGRARAERNHRMPEIATRFASLWGDVACEGRHA
jgi:glycosyltransferase involved in cell wall biosynthesis